MSQNNDDRVLTLERGDVKVAIAETLYADLMKKVHLAAGAYHSAEAAYWLHLTAKRARPHRAGRRTRQALQGASRGSCARA